MKNHIYKIITVLLILLVPIFVNAEGENTLSCRYKIQYNKNVDYVTFNYSYYYDKVESIYVESVKKLYKLDDMIGGADASIFGSEERNLYLDNYDAFRSSFTNKTYTCPSALSYFSFGEGAGVISGGYFLGNNTYNKQYFRTTSGSISYDVTSNSNSNNNDNNTEEKTFCNIPKDRLCGENHVIAPSAIGRASNFDGKAISFQYFIENNTKKAAMQIIDGTKEGECFTVTLHSEVGNVVDSDVFKKYGANTIRIQTFDNCSNVKVTECKVDDGTNEVKTFIGESCTDTLNGDTDTITTPETKEEYLERKKQTTKKVKIDLNGPNGCKNILGDEGTQILKNILKTIQYAGPILVALMTIIELVKASINGELDDLKKMFPRFTKRIIAAILLFFIPLLINLLFNFIGITDKICI